MLSRCCVPSVAQSAAFALADCEAAWEFLQSADPEDVAWLRRFRDVVIRDFMAGSTGPEDSEGAEEISVLLSPAGLGSLRQHAVRLCGTSHTNCLLMCAHSSRTPLLHLHGS